MTDPHELFFHGQHTLVLRRARTLLRNEQAARDAVQEVFLRAFKARDELASAPSPAAWLYRVTTNLCLNWLRDGERRRQILDEMSPATDAAWESPPEERLTLRKVLQQVPPALQDIAILYYVDEMSQQEIAGELGIPRRTVGFRLEQFRAAAQSALPRRDVAPARRPRLMSTGACV